MSGSDKTITPDIDSPVIYLLNPISGEGHLDTYARLYSAALLKLGYRVVLVADDDGNCLDWLKRKKYQTDNFVVASSVVAYPNVSEYEEGLLSRTWSVYREKGLFACLKQIGAYIYYRSFLSCYMACRKMAGRALDKLPLLKTFLIKILNRMARPYKGYSSEILHQQIQMAEKSSGLSPSLVFILYSDILDQSYDSWSKWHYPWVCIRFSPSLGRWCRNGDLEPFFKTPSFYGACFLDEESTALYRDRRAEVPFVTVPDVCDSDFSASDFSMARELRQKAAGRTVVFAGGGLTSRKGIDDLLKVIARVDPNDYFFAIVGKVYWSTFSNKEILNLQKLYETSPENVFVHFGYLEDERDFNAVMAEADIIYAVYKDFPYSSNLLSKAANFESPLLVSDQHLMGKRVEAYGLGMTVPEGDIDAILGKLDLLRDFDVRTGAQAYRKAHSQIVLERVLGDFLKQSLQCIGSMRL